MRWRGRHSVCRCSSSNINNGNGSDATSPSPLISTTTPLRLPYMLATGLILLAAFQPELTRPEPINPAGFNHLALRSSSSEHGLEGASGLNEGYPTGVHGRVQGRSFENSFSGRACRHCGRSRTQSNVEEPVLLQRGEVFKRDGAVGRRMELVHTYGCAPLERGSGASHFTCNAWRTTHSTPNSIACCYEGNFCNVNITPPAFAVTDAGGASEYEEDGDYYEGEEDGRRPTGTMGVAQQLAGALAFLLAGCVFGTLLFLTCYALVRRRMARARGGLPRWVKKLKRVESLVSVESSLLAANKTSEHSAPLQCSEVTSGGSGSGAMTLNQRTIAMDLTMLEVVARGRYGEVQKALYRGSVVAVKTFYTTEEDSWRNERDIYQTQMLNHENILQYVAADIASNVDSITQMMLITDYHPLGSLYDYLRRVELEMSEALQIALSTVSGLEHLHTAVRGTGSRKKPEIAHRDIKSKNIIVKRAGVCCIADFGLAIVKRSEDGGGHRTPEVNILAGTKRYMSPEVLSRTLNAHNFTEFKASDIYSYALIVWEIMNRVRPPAKPYAMIDNDAEGPEEGRGLAEGGDLVGAEGGGDTHPPLASYSGSSGIATGSERGTSMSNNGCASSSNFSHSASAGASRDGVGRAILPFPHHLHKPLSHSHKPTLTLMRYQSEGVPATQPHPSTSLPSASEARLYQLPYEGLVDSDPSLEQMKKTVVELKLRPPLDRGWVGASNSVMQRLCELMCECWCEFARSRHTALKMKKELVKLVDALNAADGSARYAS